MFLAVDVPAFFSAFLGYQWVFAFASGTLWCESDVELRISVSVETTEIARALAFTNFFTLHQ